MKLYLDRQIYLAQQEIGFAQVVTETRRWTRGWVARLVDGKREWVEHTDARLSRAGYGSRVFVLTEAGPYEAESVCSSLQAHRVRFDVSSGGVIKIRRSTYPTRCGHLRALERQAAGESLVIAGPVEMIRSATIQADEPWEAAILLGGYLEQHLRRMCQDRGLETGSDGWSKGIDGLSAALKKVGAYPKEIHKQVMQLSDLRKRAQHRDESLSHGEVERAIISLQRFVLDFPATSLDPNCG